MRRSKLSSQILWVSLITIILTVVATMILPLIRERAERREGVLREMTRIWGQPHLLQGPLAYDDRGAIDIAALTIDGDIKTSTRRKGIFRVPFYSAKLTLSGEIQGAARRIILRSRSRLNVEKAALGNRAVAFSESFETGTYVYRALTAGARGEKLQITLLCEGVQSLSFIPAAAASEVRLQSDWSDPGFFGDFLPAKYDIHKNGFNADWKIHVPRFEPVAEKYNQLPVGTTTPATAVERRSVSETEKPVVAAAPAQAFGVNFYQPVDIYLSTERSVKYAILFIALTFMTLILFEAISSAEIHPMQYFLAGLALVIFYLLLLALAEYTGFTIAYAVASAATVVLLARYSGSFLLSRTHTIYFAGVLAFLYGLLYVILQLEEFALIAGATTLFLALAATMYLTRRLDWYRLGAA